MNKEVLNMLKESRPCLSPKEITLYLEEKAEEELRFDIENHLLECELCNAAIEGYAHTNNEVEVPEISTLRQKMKEQNSEHISTPEAKTIPLKRNFNWLAAASVVGLCLLAGWWYGNREVDLFADFHQPYDKAILATRSSDNIKNPDLESAMSAYQDKKFAESIVLFEKAKLQDPENGNIALYAGLASLENKDYSEATQFLSEARINLPAVYGTATWYLAMAHLGNEDFIACKNMLTQLGPNDAPYYEKAVALLQELNNKN